MFDQFGKGLRWVVGVGTILEVMEGCWMVGGGVLEKGLKTEVVSVALCAAWVA